MEIVYCVDCGKKLREHDFVKGAAYTRNKQHYCITCRPLEPQAPAPVKPKSTRFPAPKAKATPSRGKRIAIVGVAVILMAGIVVLALPKGPPPVSPVDLDAADRAKREIAARDALQAAKAFELSHPKDLDGQVQAWQKAVPVCDKTALARVARGALDRVSAARDAARDRAEAAKRALGPAPTATWDFEQATDGVEQDAGLVGKAARFGGKSFVKVDKADLFNAPELTVSLWIKPAAIKNRQGLLSKRIDAKQSPIVLSLWDGALVFEAADESNQWPFQVKSLPLVKAGEWSHVAVVAKSGRGVELYLNGARIQDFKLDKRRCTNSDPLFLGRETYNGADAHDGTAFFAGLMDELKVWPQALGPAEIRAHHDAGLPKAKE